MQSVLTVATPCGGQPLALNYKGPKPTHTQQPLLGRMSQTCVNCREIRQLQFQITTHMHTRMHECPGTMPRCQASCPHFRGIDISNNSLPVNVSDLCSYPSCTPGIPCQVHMGALGPQVPLGANQWQRSSNPTCPHNHAPPNPEINRPPINNGLNSTKTAT